MADEIHRLLAHAWWADERTLASLRAAERPPSGAIELLAHVLGAERVWLSRLVPELKPVAVWPSLDLEGCARLARENRDGYEAFVASLGPDDWSREVSYTNSAGRAFRSRIDDILLHVALHGAWHRGQVAVRLRDAGAEPAPTDYIAFVRGVPAATRNA
jgi:uncharacterized damage-inducible protein DinB